jgi:hypothetical protein
MLNGVSLMAQQILQEIDRFQERCIIDTTGEFQIREQRLLWSAG